MHDFEQPAWFDGPFSDVRCELCSAAGTDSWCARCSQSVTAALEPYRVTKRHRDDRMVRGPLVDGWDALGPMQPNNLSWPAARSN